MIRPVTDAQDHVGARYFSWRLLMHRVNLTPRCQPSTRHVSLKGKLSLHMPAQYEAVVDFCICAARPEIAANLSDPKVKSRSVKSSTRDSHRPWNVNLLIPRLRGLDMNLFGRSVHSH